MSICGIWQGARRLAAVIANDDGTLRPPITTTATPQHLRHLLDYLVTAGIDTLILPERSLSLIAQAKALPFHVRLAPHTLLDGIRDATAFSHQPPQHTAKLLARWPSTTLSGQLRELPPIAYSKNQLPLF